MSTMEGKVYMWDENKELDPDHTCIQFSVKDHSKEEQIVNNAVPQIKILTAQTGPESDSNSDSDYERGGWGNQLDFLFSCISVSVGLGNVWRFPYLCYKNGGGAFLITYFIAMFACGIPLFFQEVAIGQYLSSGGMTLVGQLAPILQGVGYATMTIVFFLNIYYCIIISWTLFYLINSFVALPGLPWQNCGNSWNTELCYTPDKKMTEVHLHLNRTTTADKNMTEVLLNHTTTLDKNMTEVHILLNRTTTPVEEYWDHHVLGITDGIDDMGGMQWKLAGCLLLAWILVYFIIWKGLHQSGKIIWFTALFPYVILAVLLGRSVTLVGADVGLLYYILPRWEELLSPRPWLDGATQIFFAYSVGTGALPALGSYNKFNHNCYKDAIITCIVNTMTCLLAGVVTFSILGHMAFIQETDVADIVKSGPGLVFLTYPEVVLKLPGSPAWSVVFFVMLLILGIDSEFCMVESFVTGMVDHWPGVLRPHRQLFTVTTVIGLFLLGLPMVSQGGAYLFQLMDFYSASGMPLLWVCFFQTIAISWIFGGANFCSVIQQMTGYYPSRFWYICWVYVGPIVMASIFVFYCFDFTPVKYGTTYEYPVWAHVLGSGMSLCSMLWIPGYAFYYIMFKESGSIKEIIRKGLTPDPKTARASPPNREIVLKTTESTAGLLKNNSFQLTPNGSFLSPTS